MTTVPIPGPATGPVTRPPQPSAGLRMTPGRWITLMIGVPIALSLIAWTGFSLVTSIGQASYPVSATIPVQNGQLVVSTGGGDVSVHQGQARGSTARLTGTVQYSLIRPRFTVNGNGVSLECRLPTGNCGLSANLDVPADTSLNLTSGGGNMQVSGLGSSVVLDSGGGDVTVSRIAGTASVTTGGGNLTAGDLGGVLDFITAGGDVNGNGLFTPHATLDTGGGNVTLVFTRPPSYLNIVSSGGDVIVVLPHGGTSYNVKVTASGGDYSPSPSVPTSSTSRNTITVGSGGGNVSITESS